MRYFAILALALVSLPGLAAGQYAPQFGATVAATGDHLIAGEGRNLLLPGTVFVYTRSEEGWQETQTLTPGGDIARGFGRALAADNDVLAIGAPLTNEVFIYETHGSTEWQLHSVLSEDLDGFGSGVAVSGDHLLVNVPGSQAQSGQVMHYHRNTDGAGQSHGELAADGSEAGDGFGQSLAITGNRAIVGAPNADSRAGAAYVFHFDGAAWTAEGTLNVQDGASGDRFGTAVAFQGEALAVGAPGSQSGTVFVFEKDGDSWVNTGTLMPDESEEPINLGTSLAAGDNLLWAGAPADNGRSGSVYAFRADGSSQKIVADDLQFRSQFGSSIAAHGTQAVTGATGHDNFEGVIFPLNDVQGGAPEVGPAMFNTEGDLASITGEQTDCRDGEAGMFPCSEVDMVSFMTRQEIGARRGIQVSDVWGWEDPETGLEYALVGRTDGTSFIDLTDPSYPRYLGDLPKTATANQSLWRDIKVYKNHAFIVADGAGAHHMQIFDLTQLRDVTEPQEFTETALYKGIYSSHNIIINEESGFAYAVGNDSGGETCGGALHMINVQDPVNPVFAGCFADTRTGRRNSGATHDAQCVTYHGPDSDFDGREICLSSNGTALSIADVTDKSNPVALSIAEYPNVAYTHQGWLTEDHRYFYLNDEGDEVSEVVDATRTLIFDVSDLEDPQLVKEYMGPTSAIDHNLYIRGDMMYQTNYIEGLRLVDISDPVNPVEVGHFDTVPYGPNDNSPVLGAWSNYPYFKSGIIVVTSGREGVFFLKKRPVDT